jgi:hypothetical protein
VASQYGKLDILHKLWEWAKDVLTQEELNNILLAKDEYERNVWHMAAERDQLEILQALWERSKKELTQEEFKKIFLAKDGYE